MAFVKHFKVTESQLSLVPKQEGQIIFTTDTKKIFLDVDNVTRTEIIKDELVTEAEMSKELIDKFSKVSKLIQDEINKKNNVVLSGTEPENLQAGDVWGIIE